MSTTYTELELNSTSAATNGRGAAPLYETVSTRAGAVPRTETSREHGVAPGQASRTYAAAGVSWEPIYISRLASRVEPPRVEYRDGSILLDPAQMQVDKPIVIDYRGAAAVAVKRRDGSVEFFRVP